MTERLAETWKVVKHGPVVCPVEGALLVHLYPPGPHLGRCYPLGDEPLLLGRAEDCDVCIHDGTASRRHARLEPDGPGHRVTDLESTNGTLVNDAPVTGRRLANGDHLRVGNHLYRYLSGRNVEALYHEEIYRLTISDALTETYNKRALLEFLDREVSRASRYARPLALVVLDLDFFKDVNDRWGHLAGDAVLREFAALLKPLVRKNDLLARYGGEEFALVLPETERRAAAEAAERLRQLVEGHAFRPGDEPCRLTMSAGVAGLDEVGPPDMDALFRLADDRLYQAKRQGRNRVAA